MMKWMVISLLLLTSSFVPAADWKDVPKGKKRLESSKNRDSIEAEHDSGTKLPDNKMNRDTQDNRGSSENTLEIQPSDSPLNENPNHDQAALDSREGIYRSGKGEISGAFGINFNEALPKTVIVKHLGWKEITNLPKTFTFTPVDTSLDMPTIHIKPPSPPSLIAKKNIAYRAFLGFNNEPLWLQAKGIPNIKEVISILKRKYGEPDSESNQQLIFIRDKKALYFSHKRNRGTLDYYDLEAFQNYLDRRKVSLRQKYKESTRLRLSDTEEKIFSLAEQLQTSMKLSGSLFGIQFKKRIGFRIEPDEYVDLPNPIAFKGFSKGAYKIMVSPDLMPIILRYELSASNAEMRKQKMIFDHALNLIYGGFLKKTSNHSVISFRGISISVIIRSRKLSFSVLNNTENKLYNKRVKARLLAERVAEAARLKVIADLKQKKLDEIARIKREKEEALARQKRKKEIKEETGF